MTADSESAALEFGAAALVGAAGLLGRELPGESSHSPNAANKGDFMAMSTLGADSVDRKPMGRAKERTGCSSETPTGAIGPGSRFRRIPLGRPMAFATASASCLVAIGEALDSSKVLS